MALDILQPTVFLRTISTFDQSFNKQAPADHHATLDRRRSLPSPHYSNRVSSALTPNSYAIAERMGTGYSPEAIRQQYNKLRKSILPSGSGRGRNPALNNVNKMPAKRMHDELVRREDDLEDDEYRDEGEEETIVVNGKMFKVEGISDDERIIKTERVDDEGVIRLDDDELSFLFPPLPPNSLLLLI
ncbi:unnamed protein product [Tuber aestivum]|uniref:Uncharacterized protein n=1 Tax=Tuber aestivum TaxID=59557 RepID=A0A292PR09_9PEZI|nr:unnamed protein product [Tuber aestivum]